MDTYLLVVLCFVSIFQDTRGQCPCSGLKIALADQMHCFEILDPVSNSWIDSDTTCAERGGFMAHVNSSDLYSKLFAFVKQNYKKPILTGVTVGNPDLKLLALMCPKNTFNSMMEESTVDSLIIGSPDLKRRCVYFNGSDFKLNYDRCDQDSQVLCDFPLEEPNYCNSKMNCSSTTSTIFTTSTTPVASTASNTLNATSTVSTTTVRVESSRSTTPSSSNTAAIVVVPIKTSNHHPATTTTSTDHQIKTSGETKSIQATSKHQQSGTNASTKPGSKFNISTPVLPVATSPQTATSRGCGDGYTTFISGWCVPWWVWLLLGLLGLLLLLCCFTWLLHICCACCLCLLPPRTVEVDRMRPYGIDKEMQTLAVQTQDSGTNGIPTPTQSVPPSPPKVPITMPPAVAPKPVVYEIVEKNEIIFAPVPHAPMNNPAMLVPPTEVDPDGLSNHSMPIYTEGPKESVDKTHLKQPELVAMASVASSRKTNFPTKIQPKPDSRPSTRSSILTISPERSPHEVPSTPVSDSNAHNRPKMLPLAPIPISQRPAVAPNQNKRIRSRPDKRKRQDGPQSFPAPTRDIFSPDPNQRSAERKFPSQRSISPTEQPKRKFPPASGTSMNQAASSAPSLSSNSLFGEQKPLKRSENGRNSVAPNHNKNLRVVDKQSFQRDPRGQAGGVIGGNAPNGWKPWSKTADTFSKNPGFLDA